VVVDNAPADRQPYPSAVGLRSVEGLENALQIPWCDARPGIAHGHEHACVRLRPTTICDVFFLRHGQEHAEGSSIQATLVEAAEAAGRSLSFKVRVFSFEALRGLVAANIGIACLPVGCIKPYAKTHGLVPVILTDSWAQRQLKVCVIAREDCTMPCRQFISVLGL
jgi:DNA-binding transcriptional LysR family regulator